MAGGTITAYAAASREMLRLLPLQALRYSRQHPRLVRPTASHHRFPKCFIINTFKPSVKASSPAWEDLSRCCSELCPCPWQNALSILFLLQLHLVVNCCTKSGQPQGALWCLRASLPSCLLPPADGSVLLYL